MPAKFDAKIVFNRQEIAKIDLIPTRLLDTVLPRALNKAVTVVKNSMRPKLPDGDQPNPNDGGVPSRTKQSKKSKERFPTKMKQHIGSKTLQDRTGVAKIVGVTSQANHVNFDHGEKALTAGRVHKFWWRQNGPNKEPRIRKQTKDIKAIVIQETQAAIQSIIVKEINNAIESGELTR